MDPCGPYDGEEDIPKIRTRGVCAKPGEGMGSLVCVMASCSLCRCNFARNALHNKRGIMQGLGRSFSVVHKKARHSEDVKVQLMNCMSSLDSQKQQRNGARTLSIEATIRTWTINIPAAHPHENYQRLAELDWLLPQSSSTNHAHK